MKLLEEYIQKHGRYFDGGIVNVSSFLNHRMDVRLIDAIGEDFYEHFKSSDPTLILTVESSGIGIACMAARYFDIPVLFAKKSKAKNMAGDIYTAPVASYTKGSVNFISVCADYLKAGEKVLIIDDFLAEGNAVNGLLSICDQAGAEVVGVGICIEKYFQKGGRELREKGVNLYSQAMLSLDENGKLGFVDGENL